MRAQPKFRSASGIGRAIATAAATSWSAGEREPTSEASETPLNLRALSIFLPILLAVPATAQKRATPKKAPTIAESIAQAEQALTSEAYGAAVAALQDAIRAVQKLQREAILANLPKPEGFEFEDVEPAADTEVWGADVSMLGLTVNRHYQKDEKSIDVEVMANSPVVQMVTMMLSNPALIEADGGEVVEYGQHQAVLKNDGESGLELQLVMHGKHLVKVRTQGLSEEELFKAFDQAFVDRM